MKLQPVPPPGSYGIFHANTCTVQHTCSILSKTLTNKELVDKILMMINTQVQENATNPAVGM